MKKLVLIILLVFLIVIGILAISYYRKTNVSGKVNFPTNEEIIEKYENAKEIALWFVEAVPADHCEITYPTTDTVYPIKDERFSTIKELKEYLNHIFTEHIVNAIAEQRFNESAIFEKNGKLYVSEYITPQSIYSGEERIDNIKINDDNSITIVVAADVLDEDFTTVKRTEEHTFTMILDNNEWKFSKFYCIGFPKTFFLDSSTIESGDWMPSNMKPDVAMQLVQTAQYYALWFYVGGESFPYVSTGESVLYNDVDYLMIKDEHFSTLNGLYQYLSTIFVDDYVEKLMQMNNQQQPYIIEYNNNLYAITGGAGTNPTISNPRVDCVLQNGNDQLMIILLTDYTDWTDKGVIETTVKENRYYLQLEDGFWKFKDFYCYNI